MLRRFHTILIDFDSTLVTSESLEDLARITLADQPDRDERVQRIAELTEAAMEGRMSFTESLQQRIPLLNAHTQDIATLIEELHKKITPSVQRNQAWFAANRERVFVVSGGFKEFIIPVVEPLGIRPANVYANEFTSSADGTITGADTTNPLAYENGKPTLIRALVEQGVMQAPLCIIGDGFSDYQLKESGVAETFFAHTENVHRERVASLADVIITSFDELCHDYTP
jgi:D-3-phosphoglycerate dehydrogenase